MKIKNPNFMSETELFIDQHRTAIKNFIATLDPDREFFSFDEIRGNYPGLADKLTDGVLHEIFILEKVEVIT